MKLESSMNVRYIIVWGCTLSTTLSLSMHTYSATRSNNTEMGVSMVCFQNDVLATLHAVHNKCILLIYHDTFLLQIVPCDPKCTH